MPRVLAIDLGTKRTGLAVTDPLKITCNPLETIETAKLIPYLHGYKQKASSGIVVDSLNGSGRSQALL